MQAFSEVKSVGQLERVAGPPSHPRIEPLQNFHLKSPYQSPETRTIRIPRPSREFLRECQDWNPEKEVWASPICTLINPWLSPQCDAYLFMRPNTSAAPSELSNTTTATAAGKLVRLLNTQQPINPFSYIAGNLSAKCGAAVICNFLIACWENFGSNDLA